MCADFAHGRLLLFGGSVNTVQLNDTWEWDGATWRKVTTSAARETSPDHPDQL